MVEISNRDKVNRAAIASFQYFTTTKLVGMLCCGSVRAAFIASNTSGSTFTWMGSLTVSFKSTGTREVGE